MTFLSSPEQATLLVFDRCPLIHTINTRSQNLWAVLERLASVDYSTSNRMERSRMIILNFSVVRINLYRWRTHHCFFLDLNINLYSIQTNWPLLLQGLNYDTFHFLWYEIIYHIQSYTYLQGQYIYWLVIVELLNRSREEAHISEWHWILRQPENTQCTLTFWTAKFYERGLRQRFHHVGNWRMSKPSLIQCF